MNRGCHRNVFNRRTGTWQAVAEIAPARGKAASRVSGAAGAAFAALVLSLGHSGLFAQTAVQQATTQLVLRPNAGLPSSVTISNPAANRTLIEQTSRTAVINWNRFNLGRGDTVQFQHKNAAGALDNRGATLNRIWDASPSLINGRIEANGSVYLVNRNGIVFGPDATVDVGSLVASALNIKDSVFEAGYLSLATGQPAFVFEDAAYSLVGALERDAQGQVSTVSNAGSLKAADGGSIFLFAPRVENTGRIETTAGQAVLAAGQKVYLAQSDNPALRGVLVEVDTFAGGVAADGSTVVNRTAGGAATGTATDAQSLAAQVKGILAARGNITLAGAAVNNSGRLEASTGKLENGSIYLQARSGVLLVEGARPSDPKTLLATNGGALTLGGNSTIVTPVEDPTEAQIQDAVTAAMAARTPSAGETAAVLAQVREATEALVRKQYQVTAAESSAMRRSEVRLDGGSVAIDGGSVLRAPSATVSITAEGRRIAGQATLQKSAGQYSDAERIVIGEGAVIDVSGLKAEGEQMTVRRDGTDELLYSFRPVAVDGARNQIAATLVSNELRDAPLQRNGILNRQTVYYSLLDDSDGVFGVANTSGVVDAIATSLTEASTAGGTLSLQAEGALVVGAGARLDVSGGSTAFSAATLRTTVLGSGSQRTDLTRADAERTYDSLGERSQTVAAHVKGSAAGTLTLNSRQTLIGGELRGDVTVGRYQTSAAPAAGKLVLGNADLDVSATALPAGDGGAQTAANFGTDVFFQPAALTLGEGNGIPEGFWDNPLGAALPASAQARTTLSPGQLTHFGDLRLYSGGAITVAEPLTLAAGSRLWLTTDNTLDLLADVQAPGLTFSALAPIIRVAPGVRVDASGQWVNDQAALAAGTAAATGVRTVNGGSITFNGSLTLGAGAELDVSGGAYRASSGSLSFGNAGSIGLLGALSYDGGDLFDALAGYALGSAGKAGKGGSLSLQADLVQIGGSAPAAAGALWLDAAQFGRGGFSTLTVTGANINVASGAALDLRREFIDVGAAAAAPTGSAAQALGAMATLPAGVADAVTLTLDAGNSNLTLSPDAGHLTLGAGARIDATAGSTVTLRARRLLDVEGAVSAPGGTVRLTMAGNPADANDEGFFADQAIVLGRNAEIDVAGTALITTDTRGVRSGSVLAGGTVQITASKGHVVAQDGAQVRLDGASGVVDRPTLGQSETLHSAAGALQITAREGIAFEASVSTTHDTSAQAASLVMRLDSGQVRASGSLSAERQYPEGERVLQVGGDAPAWLAGYRAGDDVPLATQAQRTALFSTTALGQAGFGQITLASEDTIAFAGSTVLAPSAQLTLEARTLALAAGARTDLRSETVRLTQTALRRQTEVDVAAGDGRLTIEAGLIDVVGSLGISGAATTTFDSRGEIRLAGTPAEQATDNGTVENLGNYLGHLSASGSLTLRADQVLGTTLSEFSVSLPQAGSTLTVAAGDRTPTAPLSAGASLTLTADHIVQGGVLRAPFGAITLDGRSSIQLRPGSLTSASGEGQTMLFGTLENGVDWVFDRTGSSVKDLLVSAPRPTVTLSAPQIEQQAGSRIDLRGGGDLHAWEFVAGPGGSTDVLAGSGVYAVIPGYDAGAAPIDPQASLDRAIGTQITLAAGGGLAAGTYTLLPARYALLPGAFKVSLVNGTSGIADGASTTRPLGGAIVAGTTSVAGAASSQRQGWLVESGSVLRQRSQYEEVVASQLLDGRQVDGDSVGHSPIDGGHLVLAATQRIALEGTINVGASTLKRGSGTSAVTVAGQSGTLDVSGPRMAVLADGQTASEGALGVQASQINALGARSIVLGGVRQFDDSGTATLTTKADTLTLGAGAALQAEELVLVAGERLEVAAGASLRALDSDSTPEALNVRGDGALLRVASRGEATTRTGAALADGQLSVAADARLTGAQVQLDASGDVQLDRAAVVSARELALGTAQIRFGGTAGSISGTVFDDRLLASLLASTEALTLRSYGSIDFAADTALGSSAAPLTALTLDSARIGWLGSEAGEVQVHAGSLTLTNTTGRTLAETGGRELQGGQGRLVLEATAGALTLGAGKTALRGFAQGELGSASAIVFDGQGQLSASGDLGLAAPVVTGLPNTQHGATSDGHLRVTGRDGVAGATGAGASITLSGATLSHEGRLASAGGRLVLQATAGDLEVASGAQVAAVGSVSTFGKETVSSPAGTIRVEATQGSVQLASGALLDVSARGTGDAGRIEIVSPDAAPRIDATLRASLIDAGRSAGALGGELAVDARSLASLDELNLRSTEFSALRSVRVRSGDLALGAGQSLTAQEILLAADAGNVTIDGTLDARGADGGNIELAARRADNGRGVTVGGLIQLGASARLLASATQAGGSGGSVTLAVSAERSAEEAGTGIVLAAGSQIDVSGGPAQGDVAAGTGGQLVLRAPRINNEADWSLQNASLTVQGPATVIVGQVNLTDTTLYTVRNVLAENKLPTPVVQGTTNANRTFVLTVGNDVDLATGLVFTSPVTIASARQSLSRLRIVKGGVTYEGPMVIDPFGLRNPSTYTAVTASQWTLGASYAVHWDSASRQWVINGALTPQGNTTRELIPVVDSALQLQNGARVFFELESAALTSNPYLQIAGAAYALRKKDGTAWNAQDVVAGANKWLPADLRLVAQYDSASRSFRLLNAPGDATPVGLTVSTLSAHTALRGIRFTSDEAVSGDITLYINGLDGVALRNTTGTAAGTVRSSGVNLVTYQNGSYYEYAGAQQRVVTASGGAALTDGAVVALRTDASGIAAGSALQVLLGSEQINLVDAAGRDLTALAADKTYYAVRDGQQLRLVDEANVHSRVPVANLGVVVLGAARIGVEGVRTIEATTVDAALQSQLSSASRLFDSRREAIVGSIFSSELAALTRLNPAFDIVSSSDLRVTDTWNLGAREGGSFTWRFADGQAAGSLSLRAAGTLTLEAGVYDGATIAAGDARAPSDQSWTLRLVGGADLSAASPLGTSAGSSGGIVLGDDVRVYTGTADLALASAGDIRFGAGASVFTTGARIADATSGDTRFNSFAAPDILGNSVRPSGVASAGGGFYVRHGGDVSIRSDGDIQGAGDRPVSEWLWVKGSYTAAGLYQQNPAWWVRPDRFSFASGVLAGGNLSVRAAGDVRDFSAAVPTQGVVTGTSASDGAAHVLGGGTLDLRAGGDIIDGQVLIDGGVGRISAVGSITGATSGSLPGLELLVGDAQVRVTAASDLRLASISSPTMQPQSVLNTDSARQSGFFRYGERASVEAVSAAGDLTISAPADTTDLAGYLPPTLTLAALGGSVRVDNGSANAGVEGTLHLMPAATGQLRLLAQESVLLEDARITLLDADPVALPSALRPFHGALNASARNAATTLETFFANYNNGSGTRTNAPGYAGSVHVDDTQAAQVIANEGDIRGHFSLAKPVNIEAGRDVTNLQLDVQNLRDSDESVIRAGRDLVFPAQRDAQSQQLLANDGAIRVYGPGRLTVTAGRDVDLGSASGITSEGPGSNPALPDAGASISVTAGANAALDAQRFAETWLASDAAARATFLALPAAQQREAADALVKTRFIATYLSGSDAQRDYRAAWTAFAQAQGLASDPTLADAAGFERFRTQVLWAELAAGGAQGNAIKLDAEANPGKYTQAELDYRRVYARGYEAIDLAGLGAGYTRSGDLRMVYSQIKSRVGGDVEVLVPGGSVAVGATRALGAKSASELGLVATEGDARVLAQGSIAVNTSRWFAIDGGNILGWASRGDIDAGRGARTAVSGSSQRLDVDIETGRFTLVDAGGASGSGIATIFNRPVAGGDVKLFAPNGVIDAGEAGIRSAGSLTLTLNVANADFIVAVGASNAPAAPAAPSLAGLSLGNSSASSAEATVAAAPTSAGQRERSGLLTVEVLPGTEAATTATSTDSDDKRRARQACLDKATTTAQRQACAE